MRTMPWSVAKAASVLLLFATASAHAKGKLGVFDAWIRAAPPGAMMMAGYVTLTNTGDTRVSILTVQSDTFRDASIHETVVDHGVSKMRELPRLDLDPGATIELKPGGRHLMLSNPRQQIAVGEKITMTFLLGDGTRVPANFDVVAADKDEGD